jgi:hypothetical protein
MLPFQLYSIIYNHIVSIILHHTAKVDNTYERSNLFLRNKKIIVCDNFKINNGQYKIYVLQAAYVENI